MSFQFLTFFFIFKQNPTIIQYYLNIIRNTNRFFTNYNINFIDKWASHIIYNSFIWSPFSPSAYARRSFQRTVYPCMRNGGVYTDFSNYMLTQNSQNSFAYKLAKRHPIFDRNIKVFKDENNSKNKKDYNMIFIPKHSPNYKLNFNQFRSLYEKETQFNFNFCPF